ncbi:MarR family transcriptional regulator [Thermosulfuriphilus ammonigenes]|uniref:MarR family transcriptional regulator n=1 Tax=Thermosulfuriphilus ammonigenes TaxID=1936021 RepID=A0A6G7PYL1_9BACT|nr:MarR family transcriptional regulator [Thermosulfuriphilus ammonigenes]MBA2849105.1 DNA-binding MarR family transcriptional regulator [Thermosulfuriphilus ammonigenes]QIJ72785.1 MarR family transcriptional regulator [Thermosulfuriphilus ammonigenes]
MTKPEFTLDRCLGFLANRVYRSFQKEVDRLLQPLGLTTAQFCVLMKLYNQDGITQSALAQKLHIESPTLVRIIDRLEEAGLVRRRPSPKDRRAYRIVLTNRGRELEKQLRKVGETVRSKATRGMTEQESEKLRDYMMLVWENLEAQD